MRCDVPEGLVFVNFPPYIPKTGLTREVPEQCTDESQLASNAREQGGIVVSTTSGLGDSPVLLEFALAMTIPGWREAPTSDSYNRVYEALRMGLELTSHQYDATSGQFIAGRGHALQIVIAPEQGRMEFVRRYDEQMRSTDLFTNTTDEALMAISACRDFLPLVLMVSPSIRLRALWPLVGTDALTFLTSTATNLHPERARMNLKVAYRFMLVPASPDAAADLKVEPYVRDPRSLWVEAMFARPAFALAGLGVGLVGGNGPATDASPITAAAQEAHKLIERVPEIFQGV